MSQHSLRSYGPRTLLLAALLPLQFSCAAQESKPAPSTQPETSTQPASSQQAESRPASEPVVAKPQDPFADWSDFQLEDGAEQAEKAGEFERAATLYKERNRRQSENSFWALAAARCLGMAGRTNDALDVLENSAKRMPEQPELRAMIARTLILKAEGQAQQSGYDVHTLMLFEDAAREAKRAVKQAPGHRDARLILAQALYQLGRPFEAREQAREALQRFPDHPGGAMLLARLSFDEFRNVKQSLLNETYADQNEKMVKQAQAVTLRQQATDLFKQAATIDPTRAHPWSLLGDMARWDNDDEGAMEAYREAVRREPGARIDHDWIANQLTPEQRVAFYASSIEPEEGDAPGARVPLQWQLAKAQIDAGDAEAGLKSFEAVLAITPDDGAARYWAFFAAARAENWDDAEKHAAEYATRDAASMADTIRSLPEPYRTDLTGTVRYLADRAFSKGRREKSRDLNRIVAFLANTADAWNNYAFLCRETGVFDRAFEGYERALEVEPDSPQLLNDGAVILQYHLASPSNLARARTMYSRAVRAAEEILANDAAPAKSKARAHVALRDARSNLRALGGN